MLGKYFGIIYAFIGAHLKMDPSEAQRIKDDLKSQAYEGSRKILMSISNMIASSSVWQRDVFYEETMRHLAMLQQQLGQWRLKIARMQSGSIQPSSEHPRM
jgi:hypothetical protein